MTTWPAEMKNARTLPLNFSAPVIAILISVALWGGFSWNGYQEARSKLIREKQNLLTRDLIFLGHIIKRAYGLQDSAAIKDAIAEANLDPGYSLLAFIDDQNRIAFSSRRELEEMDATVALREYGAPEHLVLPADPRPVVQTQDSPLRLLAYYTLLSGSPSDDPATEKIGTLFVDYDLSYDESLLLHRSLRFATPEAFFIFAAVALITGLTFIFVISPITRLRETAKDFARGDLNARTSIKGRGELKTLADTLDWMSEELRARELARNQANEEALYKERLLTSICNAVPDSLLVMDPDGIVLDYRVREDSELYIAPEEIIGQPFLSRLPEPTVDRFKECLQRAVAEGGLECFDSDLRTGKGTRLCEIRLSAIESGRKVTALIRDITEIRQQELELQAAQEIAGTGHFNIDLETGCWTSSQQLDVIFGTRETSDRTIDNLLRFVHPDFRDSLLSYFKSEILQDGTNFDRECLIVTDDGQEKWIHCIGNLRFNENGRPKVFFGIAQDITERKQLELRLLLDNKRTQALLDLPGLAENSTEERFLEQSLAVIERLTDSEASFVHLFHNDEITQRIYSRRTLRNFRQGADKTRMLSEEVDRWADDSWPQSPLMVNDYRSQLKKGGNYGLAGLNRFISLPVVSHGDVVMKICVCNKENEYEDSDVETIQLVANEIWRLINQVRTEKRIHRFNRTLERSSDEIFTFDASTFRFVDVNDRAIRNLGYSREELQEMTPLDIKPEFTRDQFIRMIEPLYGDQETSLIFNTVHRRKNGTNYPVEIHLQYYEDADPYFVALALDQTEKNRLILELEQQQKELEELLSERDKNLKALQTAAISFDSQEAIVVTDVKGFIVDANESLRKLTSYDLRALNGQHIGILLPEGTHLDVDFRTTARWEGDLQIIDADHSSIPARVTVSSVMDDTGNLTNCVWHITDLSLLRNQQLALERAAKMEAIGQLSGGIAHDFNNLLNIIQGNLDCLREELPQLDDNLTVLFDDAFSAVHEGAQLSRRLLSFARGAREEDVTTDVVSLVRDFSSFINRCIGERIELEMHLPDHPVFVDMQPHGLENALLNLATNARDAMPEGGLLVITVADPAESSDKYVKIRTTDTGCGIESDLLEKVGEPFFSTKPVDKGTGLGLPMVFHFAKSTGGSCELESIPGKGTTVTLSLPLAGGGKINHFEPVKTFDHKAAFSGKVLVVDDNPELLQTTKRVFTGLGWEVYDAISAEDAMGKLSSGLYVDLLFADIVMPGKLDGHDLAEWVRQHCPDTRILLTSGYSELDPDQPFSVLAKPYTRTELLEIIHKMFSGIVSLPN